MENKYLTKRWNKEVIVTCKFCDYSTRWHWHKKFTDNSLKHVACAGCGRYGLQVLTPPGSLTNFFPATESKTK